MGQARLSSITIINLLSANPKKLSNTLKQFVGNLATNCLSVFDHFVKLALKELTLKDFMLTEFFSNRWIKSMTFWKKKNCESFLS